jgi:hypothetical protein
MREHDPAIVRGSLKPIYHFESSVKKRTTREREVGAPRAEIIWNFYTVAVAAVSKTYALSGT